MDKRRLLCVLAVLALVVSPSFAGQITDIGLFATGVNASGAPLASGNDPHYFYNGSNIPVVVTAGVPNSPPWAWIAQGASSASRWVSPAADVSTLTTPSGDVTYDYTSTFDLTGYNLSTVVITGRWAADNYGLMHLNSHLTPVTTIANDGSPTAYNSWHSFTINGTSPGLVAGVNTISFEVVNLSIAGMNPSGLRVEFDSEFAGQLGAIPEPGTIVLLGGGLLALGLLRRRS